MCNLKSAQLAGSELQPPGLGEGKQKFFKVPLRLWKRDLGWGDRESRTPREVA